jgi:hypothetical protein
MLTSKAFDMYVISVRYSETGERAVTILCRVCKQEHEIAWATGVTVLAGQLPCGAVLTGLQIPSWAYDRRFATGFAKKNFGCERVYTIEHVDSIDDNAVDEPALNFEE